MIEKPTRTDRIPRAFDKEALLESIAILTTAAKRLEAIKDSGDYSEMEEGIELHDFITEILKEIIKLINKDVYELLLKASRTPIETMRYSPTATYTKKNGVKGETVQAGQVLVLGNYYEIVNNDDEIDEITLFGKDTNVVSVEMLASALESGAELELREISS